MKESTQGALAIFLVYILWGFTPAYWRALASVNSVELLAHRAIWSCVFLILIVTAKRKASDIVSLFRSFSHSNRRPLVFIALSSVTLAANWGIFIWAVNDNRILEVSLGYFIIPLVSILFGTVVFKERLSKAQWLAITIAAAGLCSELVVLGYIPFVSLCLAFSFGAYSLLKKLSTVEPLVGFTVEMLFLMPFFLAWLIWRQYSGAAHFPYEAWITLLLVGTGVITAIPLVMFAWGIKRSAMTTVGLVQYTSPALMFLTGTLIYNEPVSSVRLLSFVLIWISIIIFTADLFRRAKT